MAYSKQTWHNSPAVDTPLSAARLTHMEDGIEDAAADADGAVTAAAAAQTAANAAAVKANNLSDLASAATARTNLGLGNVDNTADAAKPVSTAAQTALNLKAPLASPAFTGTPTGITTAHLADFTEATQDTAAAMFTGGTHTGVTFAYDDTTGKVDATVAAANSWGTDWTSLGTMSTTKTVTGQDDKLVRYIGTLNVNCLVIVTTAADQQIDLRVTQPAAGGKAVTFSGVDVWETVDGAAPDTTIRGPSAIDMFRFVDVAGTCFGFWITEPVSTANSRVVAHVASDVTVSNTTTETAAVSNTIPGSTLSAGDLLRMAVGGEITNNSGGAVTYTFKFKIGATTVLTTPALSLATSAAARKVRIVVETVAVSTTAQRSTATLQISSATAGTWVEDTSMTQLIGYGTAAESTETDKTAVVTVTMGTASASFVAHFSTVEIIEHV